MFGSFSEESLVEFTKLASQKHSTDFSEGGTYDFTRCVRSDGSVYGTSGKCRKGKETGEVSSKGKMPKNVMGTVDAIKNHPALKKYHDPKAAYDDLRAAVPLGELKKHLGIGKKELDMISRQTDPYEGTMVVVDGRARFYGPE